MIQIGNIQIDSPLWLAPMAGVTDYPFRVLCRRHGAALVFCEFVSADGVIREARKSWERVRFEQPERPVGVQIFGSDPDVMAAAAQALCKRLQPDILDINYGCPVPKVTKRGAGSAALCDLGLMREITSAVVEAAADIPVTVKMRAGVDWDHVVVEQAGPIIESCGVRAVTLHPRTSEGKYADPPRWELIGRLKQVVTIPVIGNGDVTDRDSMLRMFEQTGCDAVMIGRAALGNPWIFAELNAALAGDPAPPRPDYRQRINTCIEHLDMEVVERGDVRGLNMMRKHFSWYLKGMPDTRRLREQLVRAPDVESVRAALTDLARHLGGDADLASVA